MNLGADVFRNGFRIAHLLILSPKTADAFMMQRCQQRWTYWVRKKNYWTAICTLTSSEKPFYFLPQVPSVKPSFREAPMSLSSLKGHRFDLNFRKRAPMSSLKLFVSQKITILKPPSTDSKIAGQIRPLDRRLSQRLPPPLPPPRLPHTNFRFQCREKWLRKSLRGKFPK